MTMTDDVELGTPHIQLLMQSLLKEITEECLNETQAPTCKVMLDIKVSVPMEYREQIEKYFPKLKAMLHKAGEKSNNMTIGVPVIKREP